MEQAGTAQERDSDGKHASSARETIGQRRQQPNMHINVSSVSTEGSLIGSSRNSADLTARRSNAASEQLDQIRIAVLPQTISTHEKVAAFGELCALRIGDEVCVHNLSVEDELHVALPRKGTKAHTKLNWKAPSVMHFVGASRLATSNASKKLKIWDVSTQKAEATVNMKVFGDERIEDLFWNEATEDTLGILMQTSATVLDLRAKRHKFSFYFPSRATRFMHHPSSANLFCASLASGSLIFFDSRHPEKEITATASTAASLTHMDWTDRDGACDIITSSNTYDQAVQLWSSRHFADAFTASADGAGHKYASSPLSLRQQSHQRTYLSATSPTHSTYGPRGYGTTGSSSIGGPAAYTARIRPVAILQHEICPSRAFFNATGSAVLLESRASQPAQWRYRLDVHALTEEAHFRQMPTAKQPTAAYFSDIGFAFTQFQGKEWVISRQHDSLLATSIPSLPRYHPTEREIMEYRRNATSHFDHELKELDRRYKVKWDSQSRKLRVVQNMSSGGKSLEITAHVPEDYPTKKPIMRVSHMPFEADDAMRASIENEMRVSLSEDHQNCIMAAIKRALRLYRDAKEQPRRQVFAPRVNGVMFSRTGQLLSFSKKTVRMWDARDLCHLHAEFEDFMIDSHASYHRTCAKAKRIAQSIGRSDLVRAWGVLASVIPPPISTAISTTAERSALLMSIEAARRRDEADTLVTTLPPDALTALTAPTGAHAQHTSTSANRSGSTTPKQRSIRTGAVTPKSPRKHNIRSRTAPVSVRLSSEHAQLQTSTQLSVQAQSPRTQEASLLSKQVVSAKDINEKLLRPRCVFRGTPLSPETLIQHPLCGKMISSILLHYIRLNDIQTLATISLLLCAYHGDWLPIAHLQLEKETVLPCLLRAINSYAEYLGFIGLTEFHMRMQSVSSYLRDINFNLEKVETLPTLEGAIPEGDCIVCRMPCHNLYTFCRVCHHGGHWEHLKAWFEEEDRCPHPACDCRCGAEDGLQHASRSADRVPQRVSAIGLYEASLVKESLVHIM